MKATIHVNNAPHQRFHGALIKEGLERHGLQVDLVPYDEPKPCDFAVVWGFRQQRVMKAAPHTLVMERGHVGDRMIQTSLGWDGLGGRGRYPCPADGGRRWRKNFPSVLKPWRQQRPYCGYVLVCGQMPGDAALTNVDFNSWAVKVCADLVRDWDLPVRYRPHPLLRSIGYEPLALDEAVEISPRGELSDDLVGASVVVTYSSTSGVEAALAGVPVIVMDRGSMAWDVAAHDLKCELKRPERLPWAHALAWTQWAEDEISSGLAWEYLKQELNEPRKEKVS